jgi:hypothetical protein
VSDSARTIYRAIAPGPAPMRALPPAAARLKLYCPLSPPLRSERAVAPAVLALASPGQALPRPIGFQWRAGAVASPRWAVASAQVELAGCMGASDLGHPS